MLDARVSFPLAFGLFSAIGFGGVALLSFVDVAILQPRLLQKELRGRPVASVASLRRLDRQDSIKDPVVRWTYALDDETLAQLMSRCKRTGRDWCLLSSRTDGRNFYSQAAIENGTLIVVDGLM